MICAAQSPQTIDEKSKGGDNGRVIGYDNRHGHHRHFKGAVEPVDKMNFEEIEGCFEREWTKMLEEYNAQRHR